MRYRNAQVFEKPFIDPLLTVPLEALEVILDRIEGMEARDCFRRVGREPGRWSKAVIAGEPHRGLRIVLLFPLSGLAAGVRRFFELHGLVSERVVSEDAIP